MCPQALVEMMTMSPYKKPRFDLAMLIEDDSDDDLQVMEEHILSAHNRAKMEVNKYKMADAPTKGEVPFAWWAQKLESFPHITQLARSYLVVQAT